MVSETTLDEMASYAARGRMGAVTELSCSNLNPEAGTCVMLEWMSEAEGTLEIGNHGRLSVPAMGHRRIKVGAEAISVRLYADGQQSNLLIQPKIFVPNAVLKVPKTVTIGETSRINWHSDAECGSILLTEKGGSHKFDVGPAGGINIQPRNIGDMHVELTVIGRHAHLNPSMGITKLKKTIQVLVPPVTIHLDTTEITEMPGNKAAFSWVVDNAREVRIEARERNHVLSAESQGSVIIETGVMPEEFVLVAVGFDGLESSATFRLIPLGFDSSGLNVNIDRVNLAVEVQT